MKVTLASRGADGAKKEETFEAANLDALAKEHPEVHAKVKDLLGDRVEVHVGGWAVPKFPGIRIPSIWVHPDEPTAEGPGIPVVPSGKPVLGVTVSDVPPVLRTQLGMKPDEGVVVEEVLPDTPASRMGLLRHDVLLSVNGIPVSTVEDLRAAVGAVKEGGALRIGLLRGAKPLDLDGVR